MVATMANVTADLAVTTLLTESEVESQNEAVALSER